MRIMWVVGLALLIPLGQTYEVQAMEMKAGEQEIVSRSPKLSPDEALEKARSSGFQVTLVNCGVDPVAVVSPPSQRSEDGVEKDLAQNLHRVLFLDPSPGSPYLVDELLSRAKQDRPLDDEAESQLRFLAKKIIDVRQLDEKELKLDLDPKLDGNVKAARTKEARDTLRNSLLHEYQELWKKLYITEDRLELTFIPGKVGNFSSTERMRKASNACIGAGLAACAIRMIEYSVQPDEQSRFCEYTEYFGCYVPLKKTLGKMGQFGISATVCGIAGRAKIKNSIQQAQQAERIRADTCARNAFGASLFGAGGEPIVVVVPQELHAKVVEDLQVLWQLGRVQKKETTGPRLDVKTSHAWRELCMVRHVVLNLPSVCREIVDALRGSGDALPAQEFVAESAALLHHGP